MKKLLSLPARRKVEKNWMDALRRLDLGLEPAQLERLLHEALANFYVYIDCEDQACIWDLPAFLAKVSPNRQFSLLEVVRMFLALRTAFRRMLANYAFAKVTVMERLDEWSDHIVGQYEAHVAQRAQAHQSKIIQRMAELHTLNQCARKLNASLDLVSALNAAAQLAHTLTNADLCTVYLYEDAQFYLEAYAGSLEPQHTVVDSSVDVDGQSIPFKAEQTVIVDIERQDMPLGAPRKALGVDEIQSLISVPLRVSNLAIGKLGAFYVQPQHFVQHQIDFLEIFASHAGQAIHNAQLYERLSELSSLQERRRIAREMHDTMLQTLVSLNINLRVALRHARRENWDRVTDLLEDARRLGKVAVREGRDTLNNLCDNCAPSDRFEDVADALRLEIEWFTERSGITPRLEIAPLPRVSRDVGYQLCRMAGEALNNIYRHAHASNVVVRADAINGELLLSVCDDGVGFDPEAVKPKEGFGLVGMRERSHLINARLAIESTPQQGTSVTVRFPLDQLQ